ncbi:glycerophosphodiester phosphodiesterase family protein [Acidiferrobacter thiooxydans]|uniref:Glycerophosphodiester phosphodiesterase n=1 Tax=Acidiferrobacter thiooxydans TaxID=163359 RepID=A0A368HFT3_9GAMM|nr:glycerophosphodiester phosphodiesterase family protein [Acidiferrobacter thiooxydans]RCN58252.1 glycerophosphodiester phosphodiesterase [Acidiferrobacter thiooxydans]
MLELVAHRGYARCFPENTLAALEGAVAAGARYVEVDVQLTADAVPVLFHDRDCRRLCGLPGAIDDYDWAQAATFTLSWPEGCGGAHTPIPLARVTDLARFLAAHPAVTAFVEIKHEAVRRLGARPVVQAVHGLLAPVLAQTVLISFSRPALAVARELWPTIGLVTRRYREFCARSTAALAPEYHFCDIKGLPRHGRLGHPRTTLVVYEVDEAREARALEARGVRFIETFAVAELAAALRMPVRERPL